MKIYATIITVFLSLLSYHGSQLPVYTCGEISIKEHPLGQCFPDPIYPICSELDQGLCCKSTLFEGYECGETSVYFYKCIYYFDVFQESYHVKNQMYYLTFFFVLFWIFLCFRLPYNFDRNDYASVSIVTLFAFFIVTLIDYIYPFHLWAETVNDIITV